MEEIRDFVKLDTHYFILALVAYDIGHHAALIAMFRTNYCMFNVQSLIGVFL